MAFDGFAKCFKKTMRVMYYEESRNLGLLDDTQVINEMKANIRDLSLDELVQLSSVNCPREQFPGLTMEKQVAILVAKREIHRRAFKGFTLLPNRKYEASELGFLRKPRF